MHAEAWHSLRRTGLYRTTPLSASDAARWSESQRPTSSLRLAPTSSSRGPATGTRMRSSQPLPRYSGPSASAHQGMVARDDWALRLQSVLGSRNFIASSMADGPPPKEVSRRRAGAGSRGRMRIACAIAQSCMRDRGISAFITAGPMRWL